MSHRHAYTVTLTAGAAENRPKERRFRPTAERRDQTEGLRHLLMRPVNSKTSAETWAIISGLSIAQIKHALATLPSEPSEVVAMQEMLLYFCWAQIDPHEALEAAARVKQRDGKKGYVLDSAFTAWMKRDADAAYRWGMASPDIDRKTVNRQMANLLSGLPPDEAWKKTEACDPAVRQALLSRMAGTLFATPDDREAFLKRLAASGLQPKESAASLNNLARSWGTVDPAAALAGLGALPMDDATREKTRWQVTKYWMEKDPAAVIAWMKSEDTSQPVRNLVEVYRNWAENDLNAAAEEFETLSRQTPGFRDEVMKSLLTSYYQGGWIPFGRTANSDGLLFSRLKTHYDRWSSSDAGQAAAWLDAQDPALQQRLQTRN
jgi:hypothetical protein